MSFEEVLRQYELLKGPAVIKMNDDHRFDVDGRLFGVILDENDLYHKKELTGTKCFNRLLTGTTEMKSQDVTRKTLFIEFEIDVEGNGTFKPSGLSVTEAGTWRINVKRLVFEFDVNFLQFCFKHKERFNFQVEPNFNKTYIGKGFLLPCKDIINLHNIWEHYEEYGDLEVAIASVRQENLELERKAIWERLKK